MLKHKKRERTFSTVISILSNLPNWLLSIALLRSDYTSPDWNCYKHTYYIFELQIRFRGNRATEEQTSDQHQLCLHILSQTRQWYFQFKSRSTSNSTLDTHANVNQSIRSKDTSNYIHPYSMCQLRHVEIRYSMREGENYFAVMLMSDSGVCFVENGFWW